MALLELDNVTRRFGGIIALDEVSLEVAEGEIAGLIGPNGAGKTTAFNVITRLYKPSGGAVRYDGTDLLKQPPHRIVRLGIARTFQNLQLCTHMTVLDNVLVGAHSRIGLGDEARTKAEALALLDSLGLARFAEHAATGMPFGTLKRDRDRARARGEAAPAPPRRAGRRPEPRGGRGARGAHPRAAGRARPDDPPRRAPHEPRDVGVGPRDRPQLRADDRGGNPGEVQSNPAVIEAYLGTGTSTDADAPARAD